MAALEGKTPPAADALQGTVTVTPPPANTQQEDVTKRGILGLPGTKLNFYFDGYYGWNFNRPVGRVNLLRANDVLSNNFTLNQVGLIFERAPDVAAGEGTEAEWISCSVRTQRPASGTQNEPRPQVYRNVFQAYGTYVFPLAAASRSISASL